MVRFKEGPPFQVSLVKRPFWMLVACSLVNLTSWRKAEPIFQEMYRRSGGRIGWFVDVSQEDLRTLLTPLGLQGSRSRTLKRMASAWLSKRPHTAEDVLGLPACGKYASDSWAIFIEDRLDVEPTDKILLKYVANRRFGPIYKST